MRLFVPEYSGIGMEAIVAVGIGASLTTGVGKGVVLANGVATVKDVLVGNGSSAAPPWQAASRQAHRTIRNSCQRIGGIVLELLCGTVGWRTLHTRFYTRPHYKVVPAKP